MNARCTGCRPPSCPRPSIVVMSRPSQVAASIRQDSTRLPSASTVHAPHAPWSQPFLAPVSPSRSRSASSRVTRGSSQSSRRTPLTRSLSCTSAGTPRSTGCTRADPPRPMTLPSRSRLTSTYGRPPSPLNPVPGSAHPALTRRAPHQRCPATGHVPSRITDTTAGTQNAQIWLTLALIRIGPRSTQNGGSRASAVTSDRDAPLEPFRGATDLIADYARRASCGRERWTAHRLRSGSSCLRGAMLSARLEEDMRSSWRTEHYGGRV